MDIVKKAGCILCNDYSFPKGHLEGNETLIECAIRETAEETKRDCELLENEPIYIEHYITPGNENVELYFYLAKDIGESKNDSFDTHPTFWIPFEEVRDKLTYPILKEIWDSIKDKVKKYF